MLNNNKSAVQVFNLRQEPCPSHGLHPPELSDGGCAEVKMRRGDVLLVRHVFVVVGGEDLLGVSRVLFIKVFPA